MMVRMKRIEAHPRMQVQEEFLADMCSNDGENSAECDHRIQ